MVTLFIGGPMRGAGARSAATGRGDPEQERLPAAPHSLSHTSLCPLPNSLTTLQAAIGRQLSC